MEGFQNSTSYGTDQEQSSEWTQLNKLMKNPDSYKLVPSFLRRDENSIIFRAFNASNPQTGQELVPINPAYNENMPKNQLVGPQVLFAEMVEGVGLREGCWITSSKTDRAGNVVNSRHSVTSDMLYNFQWKLLETAVCVGMGAPTDAPKNWQRWARGPLKDSEGKGITRSLDDMKQRVEMMVRRPSYRTLLQGILYQIGNEKFGENGTGVMAVWPLAATASKDFLKQLGTPAMRNQPLSYQNNQLGDVFSREGGHALIMSKAVNNGKTEYTMAPTQQPVRLPPDSLQWFKQWGELTLLPTVEDQIEFLIECFDETAVDYALRDGDYADYIPQSARGKAANISKSVDTLKLEGIIQSGGYQPARYAAYPYYTCAGMNNTNGGAMYHQGMTPPTTPPPQQGGFQPQQGYQQAPQGGYQQPQQGYQQPQQQPQQPAPQGFHTQQQAPQQQDFQKQATDASQLPPPSFQAPQQQAPQQNAGPQMAPPPSTGSVYDQEPPVVGFAGGPAGNPQGGMNPPNMSPQSPTSQPTTQKTTSPSNNFAPQMTPPGAGAAAIVEDDMEFDGGVKVDGENSDQFTDTLGALGGQAPQGGTPNGA